MNPSFCMYLVGFVLIAFLSCSDEARILCVIPTPAVSHQRPILVIMKALAARGHQVTVITTDPLKTPIANYTDVDMSSSYAKWKELIDPNYQNALGPLQSAKMYHDTFLDLVDYQLSTPQLQDFIRSKPTFDLVFLERLFFPAWYGLVHHVGSPPVISIISFGGHTAAYSSLGNPHHPAYVPDIMGWLSDHMSFWERMHNVYLYVVYHLMWYYDFLPANELLMRKHFGSGPPPLYESNFNDSMLMISTHWSLNYPKPLLPNIIEVVGLHVETKRKPLPKDIQSFLDGAKHGVVYFSLGSIVQSENLPKEKQRYLLEAFSEIPQRVLWKWEGDPLPGLPSNVKQEKWLPQQDLLAHPSIRAFITQGGLQSFQEAAYHGIPLIGIPFLGDQDYNVAKYEAAGIGVRLELKDLTNRTLLQALGKVLNDSSYRENTKRLSAVYREEMETSLDRGIWWIEYVLRHNGARHLRSAALDLAWYQYLLLDVIAVLVLILLAVLVLSYILLSKVISFAKTYFFSPKLKKN